MFSDKQKKQTDEGEEYRQAEKKIHTSSEDDNLRSTTIQGLGGLVGTLLQLAVMRSLLDEIKDGLRQGLAGDGPGCEAMLATKNVLVHLDIPQHTGIGLFGHFCQEEFLASKKKKKGGKKIESRRIRRRRVHCLEAGWARPCADKKGKGWWTRMLMMMIVEAMKNESSALKSSLTLDATATGAERKKNKDLGRNINYPVHNFDAIPV